ncbi:MAG TPA: cupin domain-containing protein [Gaiellaceae bacterium]|nr:cupin domain-containing protein [Gaiellaceae bacterium]
MSDVGKVNIANPEFDYDDEDPEGFRVGLFRFGKQLGAEKTGTSVYELPPGQQICPYHYEYPEEEWLIVLQGRPILRTPEGTETLEPWDVVFFPTGPDGAHSVRNDTQETVRVLMYSTNTYPAAAVYPDSDKILIVTGNESDRVMVRRSSKVDYYDGEA